MKPNKYLYIYIERERESSYIILESLIVLEHVTAHEPHEELKIWTI